MPEPMESTLWAIAIKGDQNSSTLKSACEQYADIKPFKVPAGGLRVGTLDSLMSLSDDLTKMDVLAEATVAKLYKQLLELKPDEEPTIIGGAPLAARGERGRVGACMWRGVALPSAHPARARAPRLPPARPPRPLARAQCPSSRSRRCSGSGMRPSFR